ncbi:hypothetical protein L210DRAFT_2794454 [Boletus edulis BED1]|uniref:Uncharacterized protein n=1 Tax=Boletus edulis BED1 TaxID=1328754 RepID=A0AAD4C496_BOLED|nr:hypothetical protein L210DRAFT_2794454 [Boletus edulis BED1]
MEWHGGCLIQKLLPNNFSDTPANHSDHLTVDSHLTLSTSLCAGTCASPPKVYESSIGRLRSLAHPGTSPFPHGQTHPSLCSEMYSEGMKTRPIYTQLSQRHTDIIPLNSGQTTIAFLAKIL